MAERPTAGWKLEFDNDGVIGIIKDFDEATEGDTEDISGLGDVVGSVVRREGAPVDVGETITFSGKIDEDAAGFDNFRAAMKARTEDSVLKFLDADDEGFKYTGHAESYNESASRSEAVWNFSCTFYVNETVACPPCS